MFSVVPAVGRSGWGHWTWWDTFRGSHTPLPCVHSEGRPWAHPDFCQPSDLQALCVITAAFKGIYSPSLALLGSRFPRQGPLPLSFPPVTPLLSARCQESSKHGLSPPVLLLQVSRSTPGAGERAGPGLSPSRCSLPAPERPSSVPGEFSQGGFSRILETPRVSCTDGVLLPPRCSPGRFLGHSHGLSPPPTGVFVAKVDAPCRHHSVLTSQGMHRINIHLVGVTGVREPQLGV